MGKRKKVLFLCYSFPPLSSAGTNRNLRFVQGLLSHGYQPVVVTGTISDMVEGKMNIDHDLEKLIPEGVEVHRFSTRHIPGFRNGLMRLKLFRLAWYLLFPWLWEDLALWPKQGLKEVENIIRAQNIPLLYTSSSPFCFMDFGYLLKKKIPGLKWVCDLRDPYSDAYWAIWPSKMHFNWSRRWEKKVLNAADKVIVNTPSIKTLYEERKLVPASKLSVITNGY